jgi:hypothetical protein
VRGVLDARQQDDATGVQHAALALKKRARDRWSRYLSIKIAAIMSDRRIAYRS